MGRRPPQTRCTLRWAPYRPANRSFNPLAAKKVEKLASVVNGPTVKRHFIVRRPIVKCVAHGEEDDEPRIAIVISL